MRLSAPRTTVGLAVVTAVTAFVAACGSTSTSPQPTGPVEQTDRRAMDVDEQAAVTAIDSFWRSHFADLFGRPYTSPRVAGGYVGADGPACGGEPSVPYNAFYCPEGDFLAWDENLMAAGYSQIGDAWVYLIIAHEWAHAIQKRLDRGQVSVAGELQADCLAGASLAGAARDGLIKIEPGDADEIARTLAAVSDDYPWTDESDHGNAQQRTAAFNSGAAGGVAACA